MQFKNIQFLLTAILANLVYGAEKLVVSQLNGLFTSGQVSWVKNNVFTCGATDFTDFSRSSVLGIFGNNNNITQNTFNLPPHWSFSVRFDLLLYQSLDNNIREQDIIFVKIEGVTDKFLKVDAGGGYKLCAMGTSWGDELVLYYRNFTHNLSSTTILLDTNANEDVSNEAANQCLRCPTNSDQSGSTCQCKSGYYAQNNSCIEYCQSGFKQDSTGQFCVLDFCDKAKCKSCDNVLDICTDCLSGFFLIDGQCVNECPSYSTASGSICEDLKSKTSNGVYLLKSMFDTNFGESEVQGAGITIEGFQGFNDKASGALTTSCGGKTLLGGAYLSSENAIITSTLYSGLDPHWSVVIGYTLYKIDSWSTESVQLFVDKTSIVTTVKNAGDGDSNICGRLSKNDQIIKVSKNITHSSSTLQLQIKSNLRGDTFTKSFGIRELYILVDYCSSNCQECNASGCVKCNSTYYLYNSQCVLACPDGYVSDSRNTCQACHSTCKTCSSPSSTSCLTCQDNNYLNPDGTCKDSCPPQFWGDNSKWQCKPCDASCYYCQNPGNSNSCTSCSGTLYLFGNQCQSDCPANTFKLTQMFNNICQTCHLSCKTCDGATSDNCLSCEAPNLFYQKGSKTCSENCQLNQFKNTSNQECTSCNASCKTCYGPDSNNCLSCEGPDLFYQEIFKKCVQDCDKNQYKNEVNQTCSTCDPQCATCFGPGSNNCLSCPRNLILILSLGQCVEKCPVSYYKNSDINQCLPCDPTCQNCDGPLESNCTECPQGLLLQENKCVSKCDDSYYVNPFSSICQKCDSSCKTCFGPSESECSSCALDLIYLNNSCLNECPKNYFTVQQTDVLECFECHRYCQLGCSGPLKEDCDQIKYQYQIVIFIFVAKSILWIVSSVIGYFLDKRQSKTFNSIIKSPRYVTKSEKVSKISLKQEDDKQEDSQQQEEQSQNIEELQNEQENQQNYKLNKLEDGQNLNFLEQIMQSHITTKKINLKNKIQNSQRSIQISEYQQTNLESNHRSQTKMSSLCFPTIGTIQNFNKTNNQKVVDNQGQDNESSQQQAYLANNKFKFTILGNEWVSLFYFYDSEVTRVTRAILIFLKYQAFFLSSELVYSVNFI
ncbi:zinc finger lsd1 subclass family protein (macronuclear) [Tetrahymena thermophila SB210]|uniref:Zinc finger lsd1 subclass family protein n=1 Tax=Tetrahymena thermophila (strain SB210) TaxID=312017 RepID=Q24FT4_TETTS|nr:zinc finger lsd1 subclass family protein [Tetrahymena thermophila SB210]EAS06676.2 zinc finger lsd1 subclass family protein [Tetrahymena thermophila SB210]|eukprot:XP_001026921.2 zinc finger lsd1 subclass family protein [Tetrahymena thermophila SB210]